MTAIQDRFLQLLDRSLPVRLFLALWLALLALFLVQEVEALHQGTSCWGAAPPLVCLLDEMTDLIAVENVEGYGILVVAITYLIESRDRQKQKHYEAWQVIDNAAAAKVPTSNARIKALEDLNEDRISLLGLDVPHADLRQIQLAQADLREATLSQADLRQANLRGANLERADLSGANLQGVDLSGANLDRANLRGADLTGANLCSTNFHCANLYGAIAEGANFYRAILIESNLSSANLRSTDLRFANLRDAKLKESDFKVADLRDARLSGAIMPNGSLHE